MTTLLQHAKFELRNAGLFDPDADYDGSLVAQNVVSLMETFAAAGHSGESAELAAKAFNRVVRGLPLTPLTGDDDEWEVPEGMGGQMQINKRCHLVFKDDEMAWDVRAGRKPITFPYTVE